MAAPDLGLRGQGNKEQGEVEDGVRELPGDTSKLEEQPIGREETSRGFNHGGRRPWIASSAERHATARESSNQLRGNVKEDEEVLTKRRDCYKSCSESWILERPEEEEDE